MLAQCQDCQQFKQQKLWLGVMCIRLWTNFFQNKIFWDLCGRVVLSLLLVSWEGGARNAINFHVKTFSYGQAFAKGYKFNFSTFYWSAKEKNFIRHIFIDVGHFFKYQSKITTYRFSAKDCSYALEDLRLFNLWWPGNSFKNTIWVRWRWYIGTLAYICIICTFYSTWEWLIYSETNLEFNKIILIVFFLDWVKEKKNIHFILLDIFMRYCVLSIWLFQIHNVILNDE